MKNYVIKILFAAAAFTVSNCSVHTANRSSTAANTKKVPPGQAKKMNGDKSAKKYAPGRNK